MIRYFTKSDIIRINDKSIKEGFERTLKQDKLKSLNPNLVFPITSHQIHNEHYLRCVVTFDSKGTGGQLDMLFDDFKKLNQMEIIENGK